MDINIPEIRIRELDIPEVPNWLLDASLALPPSVPVTVNIGIPIIDMPGCVEAHDTNNRRNTKIIEDDARGVKTFCDAGIPSYTPMDFNVEDHLQTPQAPIPPYEAPKPPKDLPTKNLPKPAPPQTAITETVEEVPASEPEIPWVEKYLPTPEAATTTAAIAVVATTSALMAKPLADLLLKVIKPTVKKVIKKIAKMRGKEPEILSVEERRGQQRLYSHALRKLKGKE